MSGKQQVIYSAKRLEHAHLLRNLLEELGITAFVVNDAVQGAVGELPVGWATAPRVVVDEDDVEQARRVAEAFDAESQMVAQAAARDDGYAADGEAHMMPGEQAVVNSWPVCPRCKKRRVSVCPYCETAGTEFPFGESPPMADQTTAEGEAAELPVLIVCPTCDEPFEPEYLRRCEWCGHDFGHGLEALPEVEEPTEINFAAIGIFFLMLAAIGAIFLYFAFVLG